MQHKLQQDQVQFHHTRKSRLNNPTYASSLMHDSLTTLNAPSDYTKKIAKQTQYRTRFSTLHNENIPLYENLKPINYGRYSKAAFQKNRSHLSNYGATILKQSNK